MRTYPVVAPTPFRPVVHAHDRAGGHSAPPVDIDLTAPDPTRRPVDIDLTGPEVWPGREAGPVVLPPRRDVDDLLRVDDVSGSPYRVPSSAARRRRRNRWVHRKLRRAARRLRRPPQALPVERHIALVAVGVAFLAVLCTVAVGVRSKIGNGAEFVELSADLHRDPEVADALSRRLANDLVATGAVDAERALDVKLVIEDIIVQEGFEPSWRGALAAAHSQAFDGTAPSRLRLGKTVPTLNEELASRQLATGSSISGSAVSVVPQQHVAELRSVRSLLDTVLFRGVPLLCLGALVALRRTRNRYRTAGLITGAALAGAVVALASIDVLADRAVSMLVDEQVQALANGAVAGVLPSVRVLLLGLVIVAATLFVASRLEEVRLTPFVPSKHRRRSRKRRKRRAARQAPAGADLVLPSALGTGELHP